jgi:hypothetical protein
MSRQTVSRFGSGAKASGVWLCEIAVIGECYTTTNRWLVKLT